MKPEIAGIKKFKRITCLLGRLYYFLLSIWMESILPVPDIFNTLLADSPAL